MRNPLKTIIRREAPKQQALPRTTVEQPWDSRDKEKAGWVSPSYTQSRTAPLNPLTAVANRCVAALPNSSDVEPYRLLRTQILQKTEQSGGRAVMITSPLPGEGKTTTAINLAFTFAREFKQTVLLVDCDFRRQRIHDMLGIKSGKGLVNHILNDEPISDLMIWPGIEKLTLISGGRTVQESAELLESPRMKALVSEMKSRYPDRYIFFDAPAALSSADALALAPQVDYIVVVVSAGFTPLSEVRRTLELLPPEKVLGLVLNNYREE